MENSASIVKAVLPEAVRKLLADSDGGALDRSQTAEGNVDRVPSDAGSAILRESPRVSKSYGRWLGSVIVIIALLVSGRRRGGLLLGVSMLAVLKYFGVF